MNSGMIYRDAEALFRSKPISEIQNVEAATRNQIQEKKEELRQLVGNRYRDLIDAADSIILMKSISESVYENLSVIQNGVLSLSSPSFAATSHLRSPDSARARIYSIACRVKYLVDSPENIWGFMDESMFLEAAARYMRARHVHKILLSNSDDDESNINILSNFPLLQQQWKIVESFRAKISQRSRERLAERGHSLAAYADALAAAAVIDELNPETVLALFLHSRASWISRRLSTCSAPNCCSDVVSVFCDTVIVVQVSIGQVGELFLGELNDVPLFYKVVRDSPPASQFFGGIPNPDKEVELWKLFREKLESIMIILSRGDISTTCMNWLRKCGSEIVSKINGRYLIDALDCGEELSSAEKLIRSTIDNKKHMEENINWLRSVMGSEIELPWTRIRELILNTDTDLWDDIFEDAFMQRMKVIINSKFDNLGKGVSMAQAVQAVGRSSCNGASFQSHLHRLSGGGGIWFMESRGQKSTESSFFKLEEEDDDFSSCLNAYLGPEISAIRDAVNSCFHAVLEDLVSFLESPKASLRIKYLAPYLQDRCYESISALIAELKNELDHLCTLMSNENMTMEAALAATVVKKSLFIGRILFALRNHSKYVLLIYDSPRSWLTERDATTFDQMPFFSRQASMTMNSPTFSTVTKRQTFFISKKCVSMAKAALLGANDGAYSKLEEFNVLTQEMGIRAHDLWVSWVSEELSSILSQQLNQDDALSSTTRLKGWEDIVIKQGRPSSGGDTEGKEEEIKMALPCVPSLYVTSFLFEACEEIHHAGGHVLDRRILENFASALMGKVIGIYNEFISSEGGSRMSEKGVVQVVFDVGFVSKVLVACEDMRGGMPPPPTGRSIMKERIGSLIGLLSEMVDPIDWQTYEAQLWENTKQAYMRHSVLFGFFVQLNRRAQDNYHYYSIQRLPTNIMSCSTVPRFKYLPVSSVPQASTPKAAASHDVDVGTEAASVGEAAGPGVATPLLKSFMEVGSRFGESTLKLGSSMFSDGGRRAAGGGRFKGSAFGADFLSSLTASSAGGGDT